MGDSSKCRHCGAPVTDRVVDLGMSPLCESYLPAEKLDAMEPFYPLHVWVCRACLLVQLNEYVHVDEIFTEYARQWAGNEALHSCGPFGGSQTHFDGTFVDAERRNVFGKLQRRCDGGGNREQNVRADLAMPRN